MLIWEANLLIELRWRTKSKWEARPETGPTKQNIGLEIVTPTDSETIIKYFSYKLFVWTSLLSIQSFQIQK